MSGAFEDQDWVKLGVASAMQNQFNRDQREFLPLIATTFEKSLPAETVVKTKGVFKKSVVGVQITLGEYRYQLEDVGSGNLVASRAKVVRGVSLKTDELAVPAFLEELMLAVEERLGSSEAARNALSAMLGLP